MDEHGLPIVGTGVDYKKIPPLEHRMTLVMLNKFIAQTTRFLNRFSSVCEEQLSDLSNRIQKLDISLKILEAKLATIPDLEGVQATTQYEPPAGLVSAGAMTTTGGQQPKEQQQAQQQQQQPSSGAGPPPPPSEGPVPPPQEEPKDDNVMKIKDDPRFTKFFKMKRLGVNPLQIAMEMRNAGLNPDLLEDEDAPAPQGGGGAMGGAKRGGLKDSSDSSEDDSSTSSEEESDDSFSD